MIVVVGDRSDDAVAAVADALQHRRADVLLLDRAALSKLEYDVRFGAHPEGTLDRGLGISEIRGIYLRPTPPTDAQGIASTDLVMVLASTLPIRVVNRPAAGRSNGTKPYHLGQLRAAGFEVPDTLVTSSPDEARAFVRHHGRVVYKSISGVRSIVKTLDATATDRLDGIAACPVQFQAYVAGLDVRVHVIGAAWFACAVRADASDYRYAVRQGLPVPELSPYEIPDALGRRLVSITRDLGLVFSGVDLRLTPDGRWVCFEINPSPGFCWYEQETGHPIADAVARVLIG